MLLVRHLVAGWHTGLWTLPGGGIDHGEDPRAALVREVARSAASTSEVGEVLEADHAHFDGTAPSGRHEDFHGSSWSSSHRPRRRAAAAEIEGTTDEALWVPVRRSTTARRRSVDLVRRGARRPRA